MFKRYLSDAIIPGVFFAPDEPTPAATQTPADPSPAGEASTNPLVSDASMVGQEELDDFYNDDEPTRNEPTRDEPTETPAEVTPSGKEPAEEPTDGDREPAEPAEPPAEEPPSEEPPAVEPASGDPVTLQLSNDPAELQAQVKSLLEAVNTLSGGDITVPTDAPTTPETPPAADPTPVPPVAAEPSVTPPVVDTTSTKEFLEKLDFETVTDSKEAFTEFLTDFAGIIQSQVAQTVGDRSQGMVNAMVTQQLAVQEAKRDFYANNPELSHVKPYVVKVAEAISTQQPTLTVGEVLDKTASLVRTTLNIKQGVSTPETPPKRKPSIPGGSRSTKIPHKSVTSLQQELDDFDTDEF